MKTHFPSARARTLTFALRFLLALTFVFGFSTFGNTARADDTFVSAPGHFDFVHDAARGLVYISCGPQVLRYRVSDGTFLDPISLGVGRARGLDLSPDGNTLAVADGAPLADPAGSTQSFGRIVLVNLDTLAQSAKSFPLVAGEVGPYSLAYDYVGNILIAPGIFVTNDPTTQTKAPLRRYYAATDSVGTFGDIGTSNPPLLVAPRTVVTRDNDGGNVGFAETGSPSLDWGIANASAGAVQRFTIGAGPGEAPPQGLDIATDSTNWFLPANNYTYIRSGANDAIGALSFLSPATTSAPYAIAIDSARSLAYVSAKGSSVIQILNAKSRAVLATVDATQAVSPTSTGGTYAPFGNGHLRASKSGTLLMEGQTDGVRLFSLLNGLPVPSVSPTNGLTTPENTPVSFSLPNPFSAGATVTYSVLTSPRYGSISGNLPNASYTPYQYFNGADSFVYSVSDGTTTQTITVPITVAFVDHPFTASDQTATTRIGLLVSVSLSAYDPDDNKWWLGGQDYPHYSYEIVTAPAHGTLAVDPTNTNGNSYIYTPNVGFSGTETFTYHGVKPATGEKSSLGTVTITVSGAAPIARDDHFVARTDPSSPYAYVPAPGILANDFSTSGQFSFYGGSVASDGGTIWIGSDGATAYYPPTGQPMPNGKTITYQYQFSDGVATSNLATVTLDIAPYLRASSLSFNGTEDTPLPFSLSGQGKAPLSYRVVSQPQNGTLSGTAPNLIYSPNANFNGYDSFSYQVLEADGTTSQSAQVTLYLAHVNHAPVASDGSLSTPRDTPVVWKPVGTDVDSPTLTYRIVTPPKNGAVVRDPNTGIWTYTPGKDFSGADFFTYVANDGQVDSNIATISVTVTPVNHPPVPTLSSLSTNEDAPLSFVLTATDEDNDPLTYSITTAPANGTISGTASNLTFTPNLHWSGQTSFVYSVSDGLASVNQYVAVSVAHIDYPPVVTSQNLTLQGHSRLPITLTGSDVEGSFLSFTIVTPPTNGTVTPPLNLIGTGGASQSVTYTPKVGFVGTDSFTFKANDGQLDSAIGTISISVQAGNHPPTASDASSSVDENSPLTLVSTPFRDPDGDLCTLSIVSGPQHGSVVYVPKDNYGNPSPAFAYAPAPGYYGPDSFTWKANDGQYDSNTATASINVQSTDKAPVAASQTLALDENTSKSIVLSATDVDSPSLTYTIVNQPFHGTLSGTAPNLVYTPTTNYSGPDSFTWKANDGQLDSNVATVSVTVNPVNQAPVAVPQSVTLDQRTSKAVTLAATDVDSPNLTYSVTTAPAHGTLTGTAPALTYTPTGDYSGPDSFAFKANDGALDSNIATVSLTVNYVNRAPVAQDGTLALDQGTGKAVVLAASDPDGDAITYTIVSAPQKGTLSGTAPNLTYTPAASANGSDSFTFKVNDGKLDSNTATVSIAIRAVNHAPTATGAAIPVAFNQSTNITLAGTDPEGDALTFSLVSGPTNGTLTGSNASRTYTPNAGFIGTDSFTFRAFDGALYSAPATITLVVKWNFSLNFRSRLQGHGKPCPYNRLFRLFVRTPAAPVSRFAAHREKAGRARRFVPSLKPVAPPKFASEAAFKDALSTRHDCRHDLAPRAGLTGGVFPAQEVIDRLGKVAHLEMVDVGRFGVGGDKGEFVGAGRRGSADFDVDLRAAHAIGLGFGSGRVLVAERDRMRQTLREVNGGDGKTRWHPGACARRGGHRNAHRQAVSIAKRRIALQEGHKATNRWLVARARSVLIG